MKIRKTNLQIVIIAIFILFFLVSILINYTPGIAIGKVFGSFAWDLFLILPCAFVFIGLFEVWVNKDAVERNFGDATKWQGFVWAILLAGTTVGGLYVAFPVAHSLLNKGAKKSVVLTYLGASAICRIPMTIFEATFIGFKFTIIRLAISLPLVILTSIMIGRYFKNGETKTP